jgi:predicted RNase H-like HicB family nuclease
MDYTIVIERGETSYGAYVWELPGCVAAAETFSEVVGLIVEAIPLHIELLNKA